MQSTPSRRWLVLASPRGTRTARPADFFRRWPDCPEARWQRLTSVRLPAGIRFDAVRSRLYGWAVWAYRL